jgi:uncharacterized protein (DUF433 family)
MGTIKEMPPRGYYSAGDVGYLAGVSGQMIGQWAKNDYIRSSQENALPRIYSFQDVAEAMVVHELRERDIDYPDIRESIKSLRERYGADWPLTHGRAGLRTYGKGKKRRVAYKDRDAAYDLGKRGWQQMDDRDLTRISALLRRGGWAARRLKNLRYIEVDPDRLSGTPTIKGRRVSARSVAELAAVPYGVRTLKDEYDLTESQIKDATRWWKEAKKLAA